MTDEARSPKTPRPGPAASGMPCPGLLELDAMTDAEVHAHLRNALATPSGRVLRAWLRRHCFMDPSLRPPRWDDDGPLAFRYGRMTLFQMIVFMEDPANFRKEKLQ